MTSFVCLKQGLTPCSATKTVFECLILLSPPPRCQDQARVAMLSYQFVNWEVVVVFH